ncbi:BPI fold-containing family C protein-like [Ambystoma mexicanum]|uniref:BPI fold-containing family C protein-like n=1 Tax=Ambystoma mexicanum TaxID=8296 RepID=UPI0037E8951B
MLLRFCVTLLCCQATWSMDANPGLQAKFSPKALAYVKVVLDNHLAQWLTSVPIEDVHGKTSMSVDVDYDITDIKMSQFNASGVDLTFCPGTGIQVSISNSMAVVNCNWKISSSLIKDEGSSIMTLQGISVRADLNVTQSSTGVPSITIGKCQSDVRDVGVELNGRMQMIQSLMIEPMKKVTREKMKQELCPMMKEYIKNWTTGLNKQSFIVDINEDIGIDFSLVGNPETTEQCLTIPSKGQFFLKKTKENAPFSPMPFSLPVQNERMVCVGVSECVLNSASEAYFRSGAFTLSLDSLLSEVVINSTGLSKSFPEISNQKCQLTGILRATKAPLITLTPGNLSLEASLTVELSAILPNQVTKLLVKQDMNIGISGNFSVSSIRSSYTKLNMTGYVTLNRFQIQPSVSTKQKQSVAKGKVSETSKLENSIKTLAEGRVLDMINDRLGHGISIPNLPYFPVIDPSFKINQGFCSLCGDVQFIPPTPKI